MHSTITNQSRPIKFTLARITDLGHICKTLTVLEFVKSKVLTMSKPELPAQATVQNGLD